MSIEAHSITANLLAPVVISLATRRAVQAIASGSAYSHRHPLAAQEVAACS
jgi:flagellar assembly factor FliW